MHSTKFYHILSCHYADQNEVIKVQRDHFRNENGCLTAGLYQTQYFGICSRQNRTSKFTRPDQNWTHIPGQTKSMKTYQCGLVIWLFAIAWVNCSSNGKWINSTEYLRSTERSTVVLKGGLTRAGWSASHAHVTPLSALVGRNFMLEVVVTRSSAPFSSTSCRDSAKKIEGAKLISIIRQNIQ